jgi:hypothetical protein
MKTVSQLEAQLGLKWPTGSIESDLGIMNAYWEKTFVLQTNGWWVRLAPIGCVPQGRDCITSLQIKVQI